MSDEREISRMVAEAALAFQDDARDEARIKDNQLIMDLIEEYLVLHPEMRFNQVLSALRVCEVSSDEFYEESSQTLKRIQEILKEEV